MMILVLLFLQCESKKKIRLVKVEQNSKLYKEKTEYIFYFKSTASYNALKHLEIEIKFPEAFDNDQILFHFITISFKGNHTSYMIQMKNHKKEFLIKLKGDIHSSVFENLKKHSMFKIEIGNIVNPSNFNELEVDTVIRSIPNSPFLYYDSFKRKINFIKSLYRLSTEIFCDHLSLGFTMFGSFRVHSPDQVPFRFNIKVYSDYENYVKITPKYQTFYQSQGESLLFDIGISRNYNLKTVKIRAKVVGKHAKEFLKTSITLPVNDPFSKAYDQNSSKAIIYCDPFLFMDFRELVLPVNHKSFPIRIGFTSPVFNEVMIENPFHQLLQNEVFDVSPKML